MIGIGRDYAERRFGSRREMARYWYHSTLAAAGVYRDWSNPDWNRCERVVFVCAGNICRSAYAESVARAAGLTTASCGLRTRGGDPADPNAARIAAERGVDLSAHRSQRIDEMQLGPADVMVCMETAQAQNLREQAGLPAQVAVLGLIGPDRRPHIPDPYGKSDDYFNRCFDWIDRDLELMCRKVTGAQHG